jgi:hypothetical protein
MSGWKPARAPSGWRDFLTTEEAATIRDAEDKRTSAKRLAAEASAVIAPIQNRAIHRAKYANTPAPLKAVGE